MSSEIVVTPYQALVELHWSIIPCARNKRSLVPWRDFQKRRPTEDELQRWLELNPAGWAFIGGEISGRFVLDFDGRQGKETLARLGIPPHRSTPGGGFHADFVHRGHVATVNGQTKKELGSRWPFMDIRGGGGYCLFSGETDRGKYTWLADPTPHPVEMLPKDLQEFLGLAEDPVPREGGTGGSNAKDLIRLALKRVAEGGGRNDSAFWLACQLRDSHYDKETALSALRKYQARCPETNAKGNPEPYTDSEVEASLEQVYGHPARAAWETQTRRSTPLNGAPAATEPHTGPEEDDDEEEDKSYSLTSKGVFHSHFEKDKTGALREIRLKVSSYLEVVAFASDQNSAAWGLLLRWIDSKKIEHSWICPMREIVGDEVSFRQTLAEHGVLFGNAPKAMLIQYVLSRRPKRYITCAPQVGWLDRCFISPEWIIPAGADVGYQSAGRGEHYYRTSGTLAEWRENVSKPCRGNSRLVFGMSAAFAGPILRPLTVQGGGFHYRSFSSLGKSTAQLVAGSIWGGGGRLGWARSWSATKNAFESIAELHNDGCLILDEIQLMKANELQETIYMLANGFGKGRETRTMTGRRTLQWLCMVISNGERPIADLVAEGGKKIRGGADIRLATFPADAGAGMGIFERLPQGITDPRVFAETLEAAARQYYGTAIQAFIEGWRKDWDRFVQESNEFIEAFIQHYLPAGAAQEVRRVLRRFAVVACAGEAATEMGITGWEQGEATKAAIVCFEGWLQERGGVDATDLQNALEQVRECIATQHARFRAAEPSDKEPIIPNQLGFWKHINGELVYLIDPGKFRTEVCPGYHAPDVARYLKSKGFLVNCKGRLQAAARITPATGGSKVRPFYAVKAKILEVDFQKGEEF